MIQDHLTCETPALRSPEPGRSGKPLRYKGARSDDWFLAVAHPHVTHTAGNGRIYLAYADLPEGAPTADQGDIFVMELTPQGDGSLLPWPSPPARVRVNTDTTLTDQWEPSVAMSSDGTKLLHGPQIRIGVLSSLVCASDFASSYLNCIENGFNFNFYGTEVSAKLNTVCQDIREVVELFWCWLCQVRTSDFGLQRW